MALAPLVRLVACGSVDDGKSTLIGRLLAGTGSVPDDQLQMARTTRRSGSTVAPGEIDYSLLTDGLESEREQGITIDVAYRHMELPSHRRLIIADAPGHEQYTRNMAVAASTADVALLLVDAERGVRTQTLRHLTICSLMGVRHAVIAVNKLDALGFDETVFEGIADTLLPAAERLGIERVDVIPVSALEGDNVLERSGRTPWYDGPTLLEILDQSEAITNGEAGLRLPVQTIVRAPGFRGVAGTIATGTVRAGDRLEVAGRSLTATVAEIVRLNASPESAEAGEAVCLRLEPDVDITRGDVLTSVDDTCHPADRFSAELVWCGDEPLAHGRSYLLVCGPLTVPAVVTAVRHRLDVESGSLEAARLLALNDVGRVDIATDAPVPLDSYERSRHTGSFLLVDRVTGDTVAAGMVRFALRRAENITRQEYVVDRDARRRIKGHPAGVVWLTGLSGAGKSTIANEAEQRLHALGVHTYLLDGDNVRFGLNKDLGFTPEDRAENVRRVAEVARLMVDAGLVVLVALVSPFRGDREAARELFEDGEFIEVFVDTPLDVCAARDPKGLYARAAAGQLPNLTGVGQDYEPPTHAELVLSGTDSADASAAAIVAAVLAE
ncbi:MAG: adenylyl-sulfate kinase [Actinobacteria bacterium]|nr:adenylyl-sulfate kinase [Actinomycetota bacterium]